MRAYVIRRVLLIIPTLFILTVLVFLSVRFIPGDVIDVMASRSEATLAGNDREALERALGLVSGWRIQVAAAARATEEKRETVGVGKGSFTNSSRR